MICRYCGYNVQIQREGLKTMYGSKCSGSPSGKHVCMSDGLNCIYCGYAVKPVNGKLHTSYGENCPNSPTRMHCLQ